MRRLVRSLSAVLLILAAAQTVWSAEAPLSDTTQACLECHAAYHPGIVAAWQKSRHRAVTVGEAMKVEGLARKISAKEIASERRDVAVGCAECHTSRKASHPDTFEHNGYEIHVVVSPDDCAGCHPAEREQFSRNIMSMAEKNLSQNSLYQDLNRSILGSPVATNSRVHFTDADEHTRSEGCFYCHGTQLSLDGFQIRDTDVGELEFPVIRGWPNQGVGRVNPDGSRGACSACHTRHRFSIETARKPYTCKECHVGPDVPAYKVYAASKHGNLFASHHQEWDFSAVPWTVGKDFSAPTCATCHISLTVDRDGDVITQRTHQMNDRLGWRLFGLIYAHPQPRSPDTALIRNKVGLPLPTNFDGSFAEAFLIDRDQVRHRRETMQRTCLNCHHTGWVAGHFHRLEHTITTTNAAVQTATQLIQKIWKKGYAGGLGAQGEGNLFDEYIERRWCDAWLLYANNVRFGSAMAGGGDYGVFADGRYELTRTILEIQDWTALHESLSR